jgi:aldose 1-epimerase
MQSPFGVAPDGTPVSLYTLKNANGIEVRITNFGGIITGVDAPDREGRFDDVVLGYDTLTPYIEHKGTPYFGALIGRYGNRIAGGKFPLNGKTYQLPINNDPNSLHGGTVGFDRRVWNAKAEDNRLELTLESPDGDQGYPGAVKINVVYSLSDDNALTIDYTATTDADTIINLTNHAYFNLTGAGNGDILSTLLSIDADRFTPIDASLIPNGELRGVEGTPFDFRTPTAIGARIGESDEQLTFGRGYDHNWVLNNDSGKIARIATAHDPASGRTLEVYTTEPGVQFYSGNFLDGGNIGKGGKPYQHRSGFCLETQHFPDSPNHSSFPSTVLRPGETYRQTTRYRFTTG